MPNIVEILGIDWFNTDKGNNKIKLKKSQRQFNASEAADRYNDLMEDYQGDNPSLQGMTNYHPIIPTLGENLTTSESNQVKDLVEAQLPETSSSYQTTSPSYQTEAVQPNQFISDSTADKINQSMSTQRIDTGLGVDDAGKYSQKVQDSFKSTSESFGEKNSVAALGEKHLPTAEELGDSWGVKNYAAINAGLNMADKLMGSKSEYSGAKGGSTKGLDAGYDAAQSFVSQLGPVGKAAGLFMGANKLLAKGLNKIGGGTDGMTSTDAIMGSNFLAATPVGMINGFGGKRANSFTKFNQIFEQLGSDYTGTNSLTDRASELAGKKFGAASNSERHAANRLINNADAQQRNAMQVGTNATNMFDVREGMYSINENKRIFDMTGANNMTKLTVGRNGMSFKNIDLAKKIVSKFQKGGKTKKSRTIDELIAYAKELNPRFIQRLSESPRGIQFIDDEGNQARGNVYLEWTDDGKGNAIIYPRIQEMEDGKLQFLTGDDAYNRAIKNNNILPMSVDEAKLFFSEDSEYGQSYKRGWPEMFKSNWGDDDSIIENIVPSHKEGGLLELSLDTIPREYFESYTINEISLDSILPEYKEGGKFNVIPDGALHARLHHMENDGSITRKGIPVVSEGEGGELEQHAEIEREEIIFRLEVTEKIEELLKKYTDSSSQDEKDNIAIEAGKLLADEILNNTQDNTGLITNIN